MLRRALLLEASALNLRALVASCVATAGRASVGGVVQVGFVEAAGTRMRFGLVRGESVIRARLIREAKALPIGGIARKSCRRFPNRAGPT
jgi:hypothetical protein